MLIRLVRFTLVDSARSQAQVIADDLIPAIKQQTGCQSAVFYSDVDGVTGLSVLWDTQANADAASAVIGPRLQAHIAGKTVGSFEQHVFPVLAS